MTEIKVCGITNLEDALAAAGCGVDALGFIFHPASPRAVTPGQAREIVARLPRGVATVGVFVNRPAEWVMRTATDCGLDWIQLHGDEDPAFCALLPAGRVIKAVSPRAPGELAALDGYDVRAFLVDSREGGRYGGTGRPADWGIAARIARRHPLILAGGLGIGNVAEAIAAVAPVAVDINSGCERAPGQKDHERLRRIVGIVREAGPERPRELFAPPAGDRAGGEKG